AVCPAVPTLARRDPFLQLDDAEAFPLLLESGLTGLLFFTTRFHDEPPSGESGPSSPGAVGPGRRPLVALLARGAKTKRRFLLFGVAVVLHHIAEHAQPVRLQEEEPPAGGAGTGGLSREWPLARPLRGDRS